MDGKSYKEVGRLVGCSNKMIRNAIKYKGKAEKCRIKGVLNPKDDSREQKVYFQSFN